MKTPLLHLRSPEVHHLDPECQINQVVREILGPSQPGLETVLRLAGGMGLMAEHHGFALKHRVLPAFDGGRGLILFGGVQMVLKSTGHPLVGVTELGAMIKSRNLGTRLIGVAPKVEPVSLRNGRAVIFEEPGERYFTVAHPDQSSLFLVQYPVVREQLITDEDKIKAWDFEWKFCLQVILAAGNRIRPLLFVYNGGRNTEPELLSWAELNLPVILVAGSGRVAGRYAQDRHWLSQHPSVRVVKNDTFAIREMLVSMGALTPPQIQTKCA